MPEKAVKVVLNLKILLVMGKGDIKTRRGKLFNKSYGVTRPRKKAAKQPIPQKQGTTKKK